MALSDYERAQSLAEQAKTDPAAVCSEVSTLIDFMDADRRTREQAIRALCHASEECPRDVQPAAESLISVLADTDISYVNKQRANEALNRIIEENPDALLPDLDALITLLDKEASHESVPVTLLWKIAKEHPEKARRATDRLAELLDHDSKAVRQSTVGALYEISGEFPGDIRRSAIEALVDLLEEDYNNRKGGSGESPGIVLQKVAVEQPETVRPVTRDLIDKLSQDSAIPGALYPLRWIAEEYPNAVRPAADRLVELINEKDGLVQKMAARTLGAVASEYPATARPAVDSLLTMLETGSRPAGDAAPALAAVTMEYPEDVRPALETFVGRMDSHLSPFPTPAVQAVASLAEQYPTEVRHAIDVPVVLERLTDEDDRNRLAATHLIATLGSDSVEDLEDAVPQLIALLSDENAEIQAAACEALGHLKAEAAREQLADLRTHSERNVRVAAEKVLQRLEPARETEDSSNVEIHYQGEGDVVTGNQHNRDVSTRVEDSVVNRADIGNETTPETDKPGTDRHRCPDCETDLTEYAEPSFCPSCGSTLR